MSEFDFGGLKAAREKRKEFPITVAIDPGSTEYLFRASYEDIRRAFLRRLPNTNFERQLALHSPLAGTTIEVILTALSVGGGVVAAEMLKNVGKDLWTALKGCFTSSADKFKRAADGHDSVVLVVTRGETEIRLALDQIGVGQEDRIRAFIDDSLPRLIRLLRDLEHQS